MFSLLAENLGVTLQNARDVVKQKKEDAYLELFCQLFSQHKIFVKSSIFSLFYSLSCRTREHNLCAILPEVRTSAKWVYMRLTHPQLSLHFHAIRIPVQTFINKSYERACNIVIFFAVLFSA